MFYKIKDIHSISPARNCFVVKHYRNSLRKPEEVEVLLLALVTIEVTKMGKANEEKKVIPVTHEQVELLYVGGDANGLYCDGFELVEPSIY